MFRIFVFVLFIPWQTESQRVRSSSTELCPSSCDCTFLGGLPFSAVCSGRDLTWVPPFLPRSLHRLVLANNYINLLKCSDFENMNHLTYLDLSYNHLTDLPVQLFKNETRKDRPYSGMGNSLLQPANDGRDVFISPDEDTGKMTCESPFSYLIRLHTLDLHHNLISHLEADTFIGLPYLLSLDLSNNKLSELGRDSLRGLFSLQSLNLYGNPIASFHEAVFQSLDNLITLSIGAQPGNRCYPDQALSRLKGLRTLRMTGRGLPCVPGPGFRSLVNLSLLDFSNGGCYVDSLPKYFFSNISTTARLTVLLHDCYIKFVDSKVFSNLHTLVNLDLAENYHLLCHNALSFSIGFPNTTIKELDLTRINYYIASLVLKSGFFRYIGETSLESLSMVDNQIVAIDRDAVEVLPKSMIYLDLSQNNILRGEFLLGLLSLVNLEILVISTQNKNAATYNKNVSHQRWPDDVSPMVDKNTRCQGMSPEVCTTGKVNIMDTTRPCSDRHITKMCKTHRLIQAAKTLGTGNVSFSQWTSLVESVCPNYQVSISASKLNHTAIALTDTVIHDMRDSTSRNSSLLFSNILFINDTSPSMPLPRNLRQLYAAEFNLGLAIPAFTVTINKVLRIADLSKNSLWCFDGPLLGLNELRILDLSRNFALAINPYFFSGMKNLSYLFLSYNMLAASFELDIEGTIFSPLEKLEVLDLEYCALRILSPDAFKRNTKLRRINLAHNDLESLPSISHLSHLQYIDISFNLIKTLFPKTLKDLDTIQLSSNVSVDLRGNPLQCDCSSLAFLQWFQQSKVTFIGLRYYQCMHVNGSSLLLNQSEIFLPDLWRICHGESTFLTSLILFSILTLIYLSFALTSYFSDRLLFYIYLNKQRFFYHVYEPEQQRLRDVFLVYDDQEPYWRHHVLQVVIPNLNRHGLTYHVSEVGLDNPSAGRNIREVVEEAVLGGRKTVVLLTSDIFLDEERQLEVSMAKIAEEMLGSRRLIFLVAQKINTKTLPHHMYRLLRVSHLVSYSPGSEQFWVNLATIIKG